jgi:hypothetical protein
MTQLFTNNAVSALASGITDVATSLTVTTGEGALFPSPTGGDFFMLTLTQAGSETSWEVVKVTARTGDALTIVRAQDGTTAAAWGVGAKAELRVTAEALNGKQDAANKDASGGYAGLTLFKLNLRNAANTFTNFLTNTTTAARTWIMPDYDGTVATLAGTETLTNKTINLSSNTLTGTKAQFNTAMSDADFATLAGTETLTNKTLTAPAINSPTGIVKGDVGLGNVDNTSDATKNAATATLTNKTITDPTIDGVKYLATQSQLTFALDYAIDQAAMANKRVTDATSFQTQTGTASFTQSASTEMTRTYATATVTLPKAYKNTDYQVVIDPVSATPALGWQGEITVQSRSVNSFVLQMSGSATACSVRWKTLHPNAENRVHVVLPTAQ